MLRTRQEIDAEYTELAKQYGDRYFKLTHLQKEMDSLHAQMTKLAQEPAKGVPLPVPPEDEELLAAACPEAAAS